MKAQSLARLSAEGWDHDTNQGRQRKPPNKQTLFCIRKAHPQGMITRPKQSLSSVYWPKSKAFMPQRLLVIPSPKPKPRPLPCCLFLPGLVTLWHSGRESGVAGGRAEHGPWSKTACVQIPTPSLSAVWLLWITQRLCASSVQNKETNRTTAAGLWSQELSEQRPRNY